jgi:hypothetical protein
VGRNDGHPWGETVATSGAFRWPPTGSFSWPPSPGSRSDTARLPLGLGKRHPRAAQSSALPPLRCDTLRRHADPPGGFRQSAREPVSRRGLGTRISSEAAAMAALIRSPAFLVASRRRRRGRGPDAGVAARRLRRGRSGVRRGHCCTLSALRSCSAYELRCRRFHAFARKAGRLL